MTVDLESVLTDNVHAPFGRYSLAIACGDLVFVSGQGPFGLDQELVGSTISEQTRQTLENLQALLADAGSGLTRVAKMTVYLNDIADWAGFDAIYREFFAADTAPARTVIGASLNGMLVELDCIAVRG